MESRDYWKFVREPRTIKMTIVQAITHEMSKPEREGKFFYGGQIARRVADILNLKESNVERRLREMTDEGKLEAIYVSNPKGKGSRVVMYKIKTI